MTLEDALRIANASGLLVAHNSNQPGIPQHKLLAAFRQVEQEAIAKCVEQVPTNWLDPLLIGPKAAFTHLPVPGPNLEALLRAIKLRILGLSPLADQGQKEGNHGEVHICSECGSPDCFGECVMSDMDHNN